jgi:hypothetical protein
MICYRIDPLVLLNFGFFPSLLDYHATSHKRKLFLIRLQNIDFGYHLSPLFPVASSRSCFTEQRLLSRLRRVVLDETSKPIRHRRYQTTKFIPTLGNSF